MSLNHSIERLDPLGIQPFHEMKRHNLQQFISLMGNKQLFIFPTQLRWVACQFLMGQRSSQKLEVVKTILEFLIG